MTGNAVRHAAAEDFVAEGVRHPFLTSRGLTLGLVQSRRLVLAFAKAIGVETVPAQALPRAGAALNGRAFIVVVVDVDTLRSRLGGGLRRDGRNLIKLLFFDVFLLVDRSG